MTHCHNPACHRPIRHADAMVAANDRVPTQRAGEVITVAAVDLMLRRVELDRRLSPYWYQGHPDILAGAEAWLLSLRDWVEGNEAERRRA